MLEIADLARVAYPRAARAAASRMTCAPVR